MGSALEDEGSESGGEVEMQDLSDMGVRKRNKNQGSEIDRLEDEKSRVERRIRE